MKNVRKNINKKCAQDPEVPEAVKQFESLVSDGAGEKDKNDLCSLIGEKDKYYLSKAKFIKTVGEKYVCIYNCN